MTNQAWQIRSAGHLELVDLGPSLPKPGPHQVLVRIQAVALNYRDKLVLEHSPHYPILAKPDLVPCGDGAGVVEDVGEDSKWKKGDRVVLFFGDWLKGNDARGWKMEGAAGAGELDGFLRRFVVWDDERVFRVPEKLSVVEASTMIIAGATAFVFSRGS
jgi:NADPH:quinone reductase-like Zn-dependent oxidoreductase